MHRSGQKFKCIKNIVKRISVDTVDNLPPQKNFRGWEPTFLNSILHIVKKAAFQFLSVMTKHYSFVGKLKPEA